MHPNLRERLVEFRDAYAKASSGLTTMSRLWEEAELADLVEPIIDYPSYLPSFDEFVNDFLTLGEGIAVLLEESTHPEPLHLPLKNSGRDFIITEQKERG